MQGEATIRFPQEERFFVLTIICAMSGTRWGHGCFFRHANQQCPPSLSQCGTLRSGNKSNLVACLTKDFPIRDNKPDVDATLLDGAAIVRKPGFTKKFSSYDQHVFIKYLTHQLHVHDVKRIDIVWDEYKPDSLYM